MKPTPLLPALPRLLSSLATVLLFLGGCATPPRVKRPEIISSNAFYYPSEALARQAREFRKKQRPPADFQYLAGSSDPRDYRRAAIIKSAVPLYPAGPLAQRLPGRVVVEGIVDAAGDIIEVFIVRSTDGRFEEPAAEALKGYKFEPARYKGHPVLDVVSQEFVFNPE